MHRAGGRSAATSRSRFVTRCARRRRSRVPCLHQRAICARLTQLRETGSDQLRLSRFETATLRQAVPAQAPIVEGTDKETVGFYSANDFVITSRDENYPVPNASSCTWMRLPTPASTQ